MASLTPGVLSNLLEAAAGKVTPSSPPLFSSHRFPLLQVIEIVPCLSDNQWRSERFFVKVSDSLHAAYVAVSAADDADLIRSDEIQLGQFVYIRGGLHVEKGCPVPVVRGLKPVPKRRTCVGSPSDLVSSDLLRDFTHVSVSPIATTKKKKNLGDTRRLSLDSARRNCWDHTSPPVTRRRDAALLLSSPRLKPKLVLSDKNLPKNESPSKHLNCETPTLRNRNGVKPASPISISKSPKDVVKPLSKAVTPPVAYYKLPSSHRNWSDQRISWTGLPRTIQSLGKEVSSHRQVAVKAAVKALEEASAMESVLLSLQSFAELCDSSKHLSAGQVVRRFLDIYHSTQNTGKALCLLLTHNGSCRSAAAAAAWVQDAVVTGFSQFNLFKEPSQQEDTTARQDHHHYIVIQNSSEKLNPKENTASPRNQACKGVKLPSTRHRSVSEICSSIEGKKRLKESLSLAEELLRVSSKWFFKYLENSLKKGSFSVKKEEANGKESLLVSLKAVNCWLDDLIKNRGEASEKVEELRKKLQRFLLKHIESAIGETM
ncbi:Uncharacterized protein HA466_0229120 [Hirschfeldia incana]|nr:Uncharacterized protein HA466_0229120 [Hirschfeldia incana]